MEIWKPILSYSLIVISWIWMQATEVYEGIIGRGFDVGLSMGLLIVGLGTLGWYHWKSMKRHDEEFKLLITSHEDQIDAKKESIKKLVAEKDVNIGTIHHLVVQQLEVSKDQIQTNKELRDVIQLFIKTVSNKL
jgi:hypothetical protein